MIPKIIHYCWFGGNPLPKPAKKCIASWKKYCPDYEIKEWNETNFDIKCNAYVEEAYNAKKYAFVSDYVRLFAMYTYGGIYMDTDVEVVSGLDKFLSHAAFSGFEDDIHIPTGIMACEKGFDLFGELLDDYTDRHFIQSDGSYDMTSNTKTITSKLTEKGFVGNGQFQIVEDFALYPRDFFCPYNNSTGKLSKTKNTATIHWFNKSWLDRKLANRLKITRIFHRLFGNDCFKRIKR